MGVFYRFFDQLVVAGKRYIHDFRNHFVGVHFETFCVFDCLPNNGVCIRFRNVGGNFYLSRNGAADTLDWGWVNHIGSVFHC